MSSSQCSCAGKRVERMTASLTRHDPYCSLDSRRLVAKGVIATMGVLSCEQLVRVGQITHIRSSKQLSLRKCLRTQT